MSLKRGNDAKNWLPQFPNYSLKSHSGTVNCIAFHPRVSAIASGSEDTTIKIWDWEYGELERTLKGHTRAVRDLDYGYSSGKVLLASCSSDLTIKIWDPADGYINCQTLQGHNHIVSAVRFIPSRNYLASASKDTDIRLWDVTTGYCIRTIQGHVSWVRDLSASFDGRFLLSTGDDRTIRLWDISQASNRMTSIGHENYNISCAIAPPASEQFLAPLTKSKVLGGSSFVATGSRDKTIKIWDSYGTCVLTLVGHDNWVNSVVFHPGGKYLLSVSDDRTLRCWDLSQEGRCVKTLQGIHDGFITCLKWAPGLAKGAYDGSIRDFQSKSVDREGLPDTQIRCVIATGSVDQNLNIYTS